MAWRILATAGIEQARVTVYLAPDGAVWLRALGRAELLHESRHDSAEAALIEAALSPGISQALYDALMDSVEKQARLGSLGGEELPWNPSWPEDG